MNTTGRALCWLAGTVLLIVLAGCFQPYRMEIQQGNIVTEEQIQRLQIGMSRREARFVLGTPLVEDPFHAHRWDYYFSLSQEIKETDQHDLSLFFDGDSLVEIRHGNND